MQVYELLLMPIYSALLLIVGILLRETRYKFSTNKQYLLPALAIKLAGAMLFAGIYQFYYGGGDTLEYFRGGSILRQALLENPALSIKLFFTQPGEADYSNKVVAEQIGGYYGSPTTLAVVRFAAAFNIFAFDSFWLTTLLFAGFSFWGIWAMYRTFVALYPKLEREMAIAVLFMPSVIFWGSGIMKDTLAITALGWLIYLGYTIFTHKNILVRFLSLFPAIGCLLLIATIKAYILAALAVALAYFLPKSLFALFKPGTTRLVAKISFWLFTGLLTYIFKGFLLQILQKATLQFIRMAMDFQGWHGFLAEKLSRSSGYSLGHIDFTPVGIARQIIPSIIVTLFRPYLYEVRNPVMLLTAIESTFILCFTIYVLYKTRLIATQKIIAGNAIIGFFLIFSLIFAFAVGFTSYNFGALARYKIPCLPFYVGALFMILHEYNKKYRPIAP